MPGKTKTSASKAKKSSAKKTKPVVETPVETPVEESFPCPGSGNSSRRSQL